MCVSQEAEKLSSAPAEVKIRGRLRELTEGWKTLIQNCQEKKNRLQEAYRVSTHTKNTHTHKNSSVFFFTTSVCVSGSAVPAFSG